MKFSVSFTVKYFKSREDLKYLSNHAIPLPSPLKKGEILNTGNYSLQITSIQVPAIQATFPTPIPVELVGAAFDKPYGTQYILRWPRLLKIHHDRTWRDATTNEELQRLAEQAVLVGDEREMERWRDALGVVDRIHGAEGTVVPGNGIAERSRFEVDEARNNGKEKYGVEMVCGLNVDEILKQGNELKRKRNEENKENVQSRKRRVDISIKNSKISAETHTSMSNHSSPISHNASTQPIYAIARKHSWSDIYSTTNLPGRPYSLRFHTSPSSNFEERYSPR